MKKENVFSFQSSANSQKVDESHRVVGSHFWCKNLKKIFLNIREWGRGGTKNGLFSSPAVM